MRLLIVLCLIFSAAYLKSEPITVKGIVKDAETDEPIPFAHVVIDEVITLTNLDGQFIISTHDEADHSLLQISVMGYELGETSLASPRDYYTIYLTPSTVELDEVTIMSGQLLMKDVFNRFHLNYEMSRQHMLGYYKESLEGFDEMYYLAEGIVDIYVPPNIESNQILVSPIKTRKKVFKPIQDHVMFLKGNASDMAQSSIWRKDSFLSDKNRKNYEFVYAGSSHIGEHDVFIVEFEPVNSKGNTSGRMYIEEETLAILKLEYFPVLKQKSDWKEVAWVEEYFEKNGMYELFRVSYKGTWEEYDQDYSYNALLVVNETAPTNDMPLGGYLLSEEDSFFYEAQEDFSDTFWEGYNFIKLDVESVQALGKQGLKTSY